MYVNTDATKQPLAQVTVLISLGQLAAAVQALGAFRQIQLDWVEPVASFIDLLSVLTFNVHVLRAECTLGEDKPVNTYIMRLLAYPFCACILLLADSFREVVNIFSAVLQHGNSHDALA